MSAGAGTAEAVGVDVGTSSPRGAATAVRVHADADLVSVRGDVSPADTAPTGGEAGEPRAEGNVAPAPGATELPRSRPGAVRVDAETPPAPARQEADPTPARRKGGSLRTHIGSVAGVLILGVLLWRLGTGVFLDGLRRVDGPTLLAGLGLGLLTTVFSAWRWCLVARGLRIRLPLGGAVADYYRALFLNAALPGGVLGDVHRAVRHGQSTGDVGRGVRAVVLERTAGQVVLVAVGAVVLLTFPSPVLADARQFAVILAIVSVCGVVTAGAVRRGRARSGPSRRYGAVRAALTEARGALLARGNWPGVLISSVVVLAGHLAMFLLAARVAGSHASAAVLLPLALLALLAMGLPLNIGGWGPREGVMAWAFGAAGLGAGMGLSVAVIYGVLSFAAALPGVAVLVVRWFAALRRPRQENAGGHDQCRASETAEVHAPEVPLAGAASEAVGSVFAVTKEKYAPKASVSPARSSFPFSADAFEGRPMTPDSV
ncbi:flippase-like domain-containing protein [Streptomyces mirabilis]